MSMKKSWGYVSLLVGFISVVCGLVSLSSGVGQELLLTEMGEFSYSMAHTLSNEESHLFAQEKEKNTMIVITGCILSLVGAWMMKSDLRAY